MPMQPDLSKILPSKTVNVDSKSLGTCYDDIAAAELAELNSSLALDWRAQLNTDCKHTVYLSPKGLQIGDNQPTVYVDTIGLKLLFFWDVDLRSRAIVPQISKNATLVVGGEKFAKDVAGHVDNNVILLTPNMHECRRISSNLYALGYRREMLHFAKNMIWEPEDTTWRRPIAEAQICGLRIDPINCDVPIKDEAAIVLEIDKLASINIDYPSVGIALNHYNRPGIFSIAAYSAAKQVYPGDITVSVVDDGSLSHNAQLASQICNDLQIRFTALRHNTGVACSWNTAIRQLGKCKLLTYVSSDNIQALGHCLHLARCMELTGANGVMGDSIFFCQARARWQLNPASTQTALKGWGLGPCFLIESKYMHSSGYMRPDFLYTEDTMCTAAMCIRGLDPIVYHKILYYYRMGHKDSLTHTVVEKYGNWKQLLREHSKTLQQEGLQWINDTNLSHDSASKRRFYIHDKELFADDPTLSYAMGFSPLHEASLDSWKHCDYTIFIRHQRYNSQSLINANIKRGKRALIVIENNKEHYYDKDKHVLYIPQIGDYEASVLAGSQSSIEISTANKQPLALSDGLIIHKHGKTISMQGSIPQYVADILK